MIVLEFAVLGAVVCSSEEIHVAGEFTLSCFISYLNMPLQKPTPKTTECKRSSRGNNSDINSQCYCRNETKDMFC